MPKLYSEQQRQEIRRRLRRAAEQSIAARGIRKTTVDELVRSADIPKGTFYLFYSSKEKLIFEVLERAQREFERREEERWAQLPPGASCDEVTGAAWALLREARELPLLRTLCGAEIDCLAQKLPPALLEAHFKADQERAAAMLEKLAHGRSVNARAFSAARQALFRCAFAGDGAAGGDAGLHLLLRGLILQLTG